MLYKIRKEVVSTLIWKPNLHPGEHNLFSCVADFLLYSKLEQHQFKIVCWQRLSCNVRGLQIQCSGFSTAH